MDGTAYRDFASGALCMPRIALPTSIAELHLMTNITLAVTHSARAHNRERRQAQSLATQLGCAYFSRPDGPLENFASAQQLDVIIVVGHFRLVLWTRGQQLRYHPNTAALRILSLLRGDGSPLADTMQLRPGDQILDCTCGLGADAITAAHIVGQSGQVRALESSQLLALLVQHGMATYVHPTTDAVTEAMRRVEVEHADYANILPTLPDNSFDIVYFDPMFQSTIDTANGLDIVRLFAQSGGPQPEDIAHATRVARRCVVMKDRLPGLELKRLGFTPGKKSRRFGYGTIDT